MVLSGGRHDHPQEEEEEEREILDEIQKVYRSLVCVCFVTPKTHTLVSSHVTFVAGVAFGVDGFLVVVCSLFHGVCCVCNVMTSRCVRNYHVQWGFIFFLI